MEPSFHGDLRILLLPDLPAVCRHAECGSAKELNNIERGRRFHMARREHFVQIYDLHTHTTMSDGHVSIDDLVAWEHGMGHQLGVSDHVFYEGIFTERDIAAYLEVLRRYPVYRGIEANMEHHFALPDSLDTQIDYVIASIHNMPDGRGGMIPMDSFFKKRSGNMPGYTKNYSSDLNRWYLAHSLRLIEKALANERIDILGHITLMPCCDELYGTKFLLDWENAVLNLCRRHCVALEISGLWRLPNMEMLRRAKEMGILFSMGSDCHEAKDVGVLDYCKLAVDTIGLSEEDFFVPARALY